MTRHLSILCLSAATLIAFSPISDANAAKKKKSPLPAPIEAPMEAAPASDYRTTPMAVIRFNQRKVYYERPLYEAVGRAVEAKPGVRFTLRSLVPPEGEERAERNLDKVYRTMTDMGVPASRIAVERQQAAVTDSEVHVFVR